MPYTLDWSTAGNNGTFTLTDGADSTDVTITTIAATDGRTATVQTSGSPAETALWVSSLTEPVTTTLAFDDPVANLSFEIFDIDARVNGWDDQLTIIAYDANGNEVPVQYSDLDGLHSINGNTLDADGNASTGVETSGADDTVTISIPGPVTTITFIFDNGESWDSSGRFGISDIVMEAATPDYVVEGGSGDDIIDAGYTGDPEGDSVDGGDALDLSDDDVIVGGGGDDQISAGAGADLIYGDRIEFDPSDHPSGTEGAASSFTFVNDSPIEVQLFSIDDAGNAVAGAVVAAGGSVPVATLSDINWFIADTDGNALEYYGNPSNGSTVTYDSDGNDSILGGAAADTVFGEYGDDTIFGEGGADSLVGGLGDDSLDGDDGADVLDGGDGADTLIGDGGIDTLLGGDGADVIIDTGTEGNSVEGGDGADTITTGDGADTIDGGSGDDSIIGGAGGDTIAGGDDNDTVRAGDDNDTVRAGDDNDFVTGGIGADSLFGDDGTDTIYGGTGGDSIDGGTGGDSLVGDEGEDTMTGGAGSDTMDGGLDNDLMYGGDNDDTVYGNVGDDTLYGGEGNDFVRGSFGNDELHGGTGDDSIWGGFYDDTIVVEDNFGNDTIDGDDPFETLGDTLDLTAVTTGLTVDLTSSNPENGTFSDGVSTASFTDIENIVLGGGDDTLTLADFGGGDIVQGFQAPTVNGDGSLTGNDMVDVSAVTSDFGTTPVTVRDVTVTDDGSGNAVLNFPGGESLTLVGIDPVTAADHAFLVAIGIPSNLIVDGTAGDDAMGTTYVDSEGDQTDGTDGVDDTILGYGGDDTIDGGLGADTIDGGADNDDIDGGAGNDDIEGGSGDDTITGGADQDTIDGGSGDDSLSGGAGNDTIDGWTGDDTLVADGGDDSLTGFDGDDTFELTDATGDSTIVGGEDVETAGDTLDLSGVTEDLQIDLTALNSETGTVSDGTNTTGFTEIENITLGGGIDTIILADGGGTDTVEGFEAPTDNGDGTFTGVDQLDVSAVTSGGSNPVHANDVVVTDDGSGNAVLNFPGGETLTLTGIPVVDASNPAYLVAMGIPSDGILTGTAGDDIIEAGTWLDEDAEVVDGGDALITGEAPDDDIIQGGAGDDSITAGAGDDDVDGGFDNDTIDGGIGDDSLVGGSGEDSLLGGADDDTLEGQDGLDTLDGGAGNDSLSGGDSEDSLSGGAGADTLDGGSGRDTLDGEGGDDSISGEDDQDQINLGADDGADTIDGGSGGVDFDTLQVTDNVDTQITFTGDESGTGSLGTGTIEFSEIEAVATGSGADTIDASGDSTGLDLDGGAGADEITGGSGADSLSGGDDADTIEAGRNDTVDGGSGGDDNDTLIVTGPATITYDPFDSEAGTVTWLDGQSLTFSDIENIDYIPCFTPGTLIKTARGEVPVEQLRVGDRALTRDNGYQVIRWLGSRMLDVDALRQNPALKPIRIAQGALGAGLPERDMMVSPQHRMLMSGPECELWFGEQEVLVAALHLTCLDGVDEVAPDEVSYLHMLFDQHEVVMSDGSWSESFQPGDLTLGALDGAQRRELLELFPELESCAQIHNIYPSARMTLKAHQARVLFAG